MLSVHQGVPTLPHAGNFRARKVNLPIHCHQQLHRFNLCIVRAQRSSRVHELVGQVFDRVPQNFQSAACLGRNSAPAYWQYLPLLMQILAAILLGVGMVTASWFVGRHRNTKVKLAAYECGIEAVGDARGRFSVRFYLVAVLFILFDVEAVFMMPWAVIYRQSCPRITGRRSSASGRCWSTSALWPSDSTTSCARAS
jgi:NADH-quinone oxidoreductase subunit A